MTWRQGRPPAPGRTSGPPAAGRRRAPGSADRPVSGRRPCTGLLCAALRLPVFVAVNAVLGITAHALDAGMLPGVAGLTTSLMGVLVVGVVLCRRERSFEAICVALLAGQAATHVALCTPAVLARPTVGAVHEHTSGGGTLAVLVPSSSMLLAHLLAAGVAAWWLYRGETAVWDALRRVMPALGLLARSPSVLPAATAPRPCARAAVVVLHDRVGATRSRPRRGPPLPVAA